MGIVRAVVTNGIALFLTTGVPGITFRGHPAWLLACGAILGLFNLTVRPLALLFSLPFILLTLGLFYLVVNGILLWLASFLLPGYSVDGIFSGVLGSLIMGLANWSIETLFFKRRPASED